MNLPRAGFMKHPAQLRCNQKAQHMIFCSPLACVEIDCYVLKKSAAASPAYMTPEPAAAASGQESLHVLLCWT